jgi:drug/metabolite transporter (DMT)-like permease
VGALFAVAAALAFALGTVLQQKGTLSTDAGENDPRFFVEILHEPVWLLGLFFQAVGWVLQAIALDRASLVVTQSLISLSLVAALPLGAWLTSQHIGPREIAGAVFTLVGIGLFLSAGQPQGGTNHPGALTWWVACSVTLALVGVLALVGHRLQGAERAVAFGIAAGLGFGLQAAVTKTFVTLVPGGVVALLGNWSTYLLILTALLGFGLQQSALKTGVLAPAMASSNSVTLFASVAFGILVYGETLTKSGGSHVGFAILGLVVAVVGIILLASSTSPSEPKSASQTPVFTARVSQP